jgi:hypothetical protein
MTIDMMAATVPRQSYTVTMYNVNTQQFIDDYIQVL